MRGSSNNLIFDKSTLVLGLLLLAAGVSLNSEVFSIAEVSGAGECAPEPLKCSFNVINNHSFENGIGQFGLPVGWGNWTKHGPPDSTITVDSTHTVSGSFSAKLDLGQTEIGFISIYQSLPSNTFYSNLTDRPDGIDMWFWVEPKLAGLGDYRIRVLGPGEVIGELNYVFDRDPILSYPNSSHTFDDGKKGGSKNIFLSGYPPGQWHHLQRNLRADWQAPLRLYDGSMAPGFSLDLPFLRVQFDLLAFRDSYSGSYFSETAWIDDFKIYLNSETPPPPPEMHWTAFNFTDRNGNIVDESVKWKLFDSLGREVSYTRGQLTLPTDTYNLEAYYPTYTQQSPEPYKIYRKTIPLDTSSIIQLSMMQHDSTPYGYIAFDSEEVQASILRQDPTNLTFTAIGASSANTPYLVLVKVPGRPTILVKDDTQLVEPAWSYDNSLDITRIPTTTLGRFSLFFGAAVTIPRITLIDMAGNSLDGLMKWKVVDSQGLIICNDPTCIGDNIPIGNFTLEVQYEGFLIYRKPLDFSRTSPITLPMTPINIPLNGFIMVNSTVTGISVLDDSSSRIAFAIDGTGPSTILVKTLKKPLYVEKDGMRIVSWIYYDSTGTVAIETAELGSFLVVLERKTELSSYWVIGATASMILTGTFAGLLWLRRKKPSGAMD